MGSDRVETIQVASEAPTRRVHTKVQTRQVAEVSGMTVVDGSLGAKIAVYCGEQQQKKKKKKKKKNKGVVDWMLKLEVRVTRLG
ncbi:hypothetical protein FQN51_002282 [Onygenales sp. PD_10]|nr:hypothetical protein FQN51_002282 [Onygenales sp. PD_10]